MPKERLLWIDVARTIAIILIVGFHLIYELKPDQSFRIIGYIGVSIFFIVSGFILTKKYPNIKSFELAWFKKRYVRIASLYYPALIAMVLLFSTQTYYRGFYDLILHFAFLNFLSHDTLYSIISPAWFLIPLMALYLLFPYLNRALSWSKYLLIIAFLLSFAVRITGLDNSPYPLIFSLSDFCLGIAFAQDRKNLVLAAPLLMAIISPIMIVPYVLFYLLSFLENLNLPISGIFSGIGKYSFEIFLFHESIMMTLLGKWNIYGLSTLPSLGILILVLLIVEWISKVIQGMLLSKEGG